MSDEPWGRVFIDGDGDACLEPSGRDRNLVALPARDHDGTLLNQVAWGQMVRCYNDWLDLGGQLERAIARAERAEAENAALRALITKETTE